jgi:acyl carrier protein
MAAVNLEELCGLVERTLCEATMKDQLVSPVHGQSKMGDPIEWDSLSFIMVLTAVSDAYEVDLADDDAFHFTSIPTMHAFLHEIMSE